MEYLTLVTAIVTFILGLIAKKVKWVDNRMIPLQNLIIGLIMATIEYIITKDFSVAIAASGLFTGGLYDLGKNLLELTSKKSEE